MPSHPYRRIPAAAAVGLTTLGALLAATLGGCLDPATRQQMAASDSILGAIATQPSVADAARWASDPYDADKRARGTSMLANAPFGGADAYLAMYREYVKDKESPGVRAAAARGLGMHGSPEDVDLILPLLKDPEKSVKLDAIKALQRLHNPDAIDPLIELTKIDKEPEADIRAEAASALGQYATPNVLQALIAALADDQLVVSHNALTSLQTLTGNTDLPDDRKLWLTWANGNKAPFANQRPYFYPAFNRDSRWLDYVPFIGGPAPNEQSAQPAGMPAVVGAESWGTSPLREPATK